MRIIRRRRKNINLSGKMFLVAIVIIISVWLVDNSLRPIITKYSTNQSTNHVTKLINQAVYEEITENEISYGNLVNLTYGESGEVTALQTDMLELNRLQASVTSRIIDHMMDYNMQTISIPLGTLLGSPIFSGRGPIIEIRLIPSNFIKTKITNDFDSAGINQTRHRVMLEIELVVSAILPGYSTFTNISTNVMLAETVVVGIVPDAYTEVSSADDPIVGMIEDYGAG